MDLYEELMRTCPTVMGENGPVCGFDCPLGWNSLVRTLVEALEAHAKASNPALRVDQVKSKFGGLRCYLSEHDEVAEALIRDFESRSTQTCETCGSPGKQVGKGWIMTMCLEHARLGDV